MTKLQKKAKSEPKNDHVPKGQLSVKLETGKCTNIPQKNTKAQWKIAKKNSQEMCYLPLCGDIFLRFAVCVQYAHCTVMN